MTVNRSSFAASGASYLVRYSAEIVLTATLEVIVTIADVYPNDPFLEDIESAKHAIQAGCLEVLSSAEIGAYVTVHGLIIHPVDFKPRQYARWTAFDLQSHLDAVLQG